MKVFTMVSAILKITCKKQSVLFNIFFLQEVSLTRVSFLSFLSFEKRYGKTKA